MPEDKVSKNEAPEKQAPKKRPRRVVTTVPMSRLAPGFNHDIPYRGIVYHVQTEFLERPTPHIGTQIYRQGRIVEAEKTPLEGRRLRSEAELGSVMTEQHKTMIRRLVSGQVKDDATLAPALSEDRPAGPQEAARDRDGDLRARRRELAHRRHLELRRSASRVARAVRPEQPPARDQVRTRLGAIVSSMAEVALRHPYRQSRHEELAQLLMLRSEAIEWLRDPDATEESGLRLWEGFAVIARALVAVNGRREVIAHDRQIWGRARAALATRGDQDAVDPELLRELRTTWGRCKALDELLDFGSGLRAGALTAAIEAALQSLEEDCAALRGEGPSERPPRPGE
jgi:hypothetical protein